MRQKERESKAKTNPLLSGKALFDIVVNGDAEIGFIQITDRTKDPAHAWRHRFEDQARRAGVPQNVTDGLLGHLNAMNESEGYGRGFRFMPDATAPWLDKMASPFQAPIAVPSGPLQSAA